MGGRVLGLDPETHGLEGLPLDDALGLVELLLNGNARALFDVDAKERKLASAPWV